MASADPEIRWEKKYKFFSNKSMKRRYPVYDRARHDPFNKDPSWGKSVLCTVADELEKSGGLQKEMTSVNKDGLLHRPAMSKILTKVLPKLSDMEMTALFNVVDADSSGEVTVGEFLGAIENGRQIHVPPESAERWRNPLNRIKRMPPARVEGWDHLEDDVYGAYKAPNALEEGEESLKRVNNMLKSSPQSLEAGLAPPKYKYFGGGGDHDRFLRQGWNSARGSSSSECGTSQVPSVLPDPGGLDVRPGFLCQRPGLKMSTLAAPLSARNPRTPGSTVRS